MNPLNISDLPLSSKASLCWSFLWRGILISIGSGLCGAILGGIAGFILGLAGVPKAAPVIGGILGLGAGLIFIYLFVRWLLSSRLGQFRLLLVQAEHVA